MPPPFPPHVAADVEESRALYDLVKEQDRDGAAGIVQGEKALAPRAPRRDDRAARRHPYDDPRSFAESPIAPTRSHVT